MTCRKGFRGLTEYQIPDNNPLSGNMAWTHSPFDSWPGMIRGGNQNDRVLAWSVPPGLSDPIGSFLYSQTDQTISEASKQHSLFTTQPLLNTASSTHSHF